MVHPFHDLLMGEKMTEVKVWLKYDRITCMFRDSTTFNFAGRDINIGNSIIKLDEKNKLVEIPFWLVKKEELEGYIND